MPRRTCYFSTQPKYSFTFLGICCKLKRLTIANFNSFNLFLWLGLVLFWLSKSASWHGKKNLSTISCLYLSRYFERRVTILMKKNRLISTPVRSSLVHCWLGAYLSATNEKQSGLGDFVSYIDRTDISNWIIEDSPYFLKRCVQRAQKKSLGKALRVEVARRTLSTFSGLKVGPLHELCLCSETKFNEAILEVVLACRRKRVIACENFWFFAR